jgi:hypothetical protein
VSSHALATYLRRSLPEGLPYVEAIQLFLRLYCTVEGVPSTLARECTRQGLTEAFASLTQLKWVHEPDDVGAGGGSPDLPMSEPTHWNRLIDSLLSGNLEYDMATGRLLARRVGWDRKQT